MIKIRGLEIIHAGGRSRVYPLSSITAAAVLADAGHHLTVTRRAVLAVLAAGQAVNLPGCQIRGVIS